MNDNAPFKVSFQKGWPDGSTIADSLGVEERCRDLIAAMEHYVATADVDGLDLERNKDQMYEHVSALCRTPNELFLLGYLMGSADKQGLVEAGQRLFNSCRDRRCATKARKAWEESLIRTTP